ncbi:prostate stem cell antigen [Tamandua tetradactyla]|uniref:prostate stem cell antigen n=1 Tax=Tamandua tetradactyla TaxID=48850 RepID=UPI0040546F5F
MAALELLLSLGPAPWSSWKEPDPGGHLRAKQGRPLRALGYPEDPPEPLYGSPCQHGVKSGYQSPCLSERRGPAELLEERSEKAAVLVLLAAGLALQPGTALQCYFCRVKVSGACQAVQNCTRDETYCRTEHIRAVGLSMISKSCSSQCKEGWQDFYLGRKNVTCCSTDLCNASGTSALQPPIGALGLLALLGGLLLWGPSQP